MTIQRYDTHVRGQNFLLRWSREIDDDTNWSLQSYYDNVERSDEQIDDMQRKFDLDFQCRFPVGTRHNVVCGADYRHIQDDLNSHTPDLAFIPARRGTRA